MVKEWGRKVAVKAAALAGVLLLGATQFALAGTNTSVSLPNPLSTNSFSAVVASVTQFLITTIAIPLTAIMALVGGFQMITAAGNPEKFASGRKTLTYAAIGFVIVLLASSVTYIIKSIFQGA